MSPSDFTTVRVVGGLMPTDLLGRVLAGDKDLGGLTGSDYHLLSGESPREAANRSWSYLLGAWQSYRQALARLPDGDAAVGLTREKWLTVLFKELDYGRLQPTPAGGLVVDDKTFPVSHLWGATPLHLLGWGVDLDKRTKGVPGAADRAPQAMLQELLNRTSDYLWAMLSNGRSIRLLRDSTSLAGSAYVEFDLESMFDGEVFSDFVLLYLLLHQSRVEVLTDGIPADCWLEKWRTSAAETGTRALGLLRDGVKEALEALGTGFLQAPGNNLNARIADGTLSIEDFHRSLLRLVYRLLFLFVSEDRGLLLAPDANQTAIRRFHEYYSTSRLRTLVRKRRGARHIDQWEALQLVITALGEVNGLPDLGLPGLGGIFNPEPIDVVMRQHLPNEALFAAIRKLSIVHPKGTPPRIVDYRNLGAEELGSIYESLLELVPRHDQLDRTFILVNLAGNDRKTSGSYYTPTSLIDLVLDEALDPLLDEREKDQDPERSLLSMTVCDPACGSGHFLVAAARRIATRLAAVRTGEADPTPADIQEAMHDVVARCIYGVDLNPMAAELAKVSLWLEAMQAGKPLSFLDAHIKVGNALLGTTPELLERGLPDEAFVALLGDDKKWLAALKKRNKAEREKSAQGELFGAGGLAIDTRGVAERVRELDAIAAVSLDDVKRIEKRYRDLEDDPTYASARLVADAWCAAFVCRKSPEVPAITHGVIEQLQADATGDPVFHEAVNRIAVEYRFFHWYLEFPQVFGGTGTGFTAIVGNPPWERLKLQEQEFFASRDTEVAKARNSSERSRRIRELEKNAPDLHAAFLEAKRAAEAASHFARASGRFEWGGLGDVNTYALFADLAYESCSPMGRSGLVLPVGLVAGFTYRHFVHDMLSSKRLTTLAAFENGDFLFPDIHDQIQFCVWVVGGKSVRHERPLFAARLRQVSQFADSTRNYEISSDDLESINPNTGTIPLFRFRRDAEVTAAIYRSFGVLQPLDRPNTWKIRFTRVFDMANDADQFRTAEELDDIGAERLGPDWWLDSTRWVPLYEGKLIWVHDHRYGTYLGQTQPQQNEGKVPHVRPEQHQDAAFFVTPRYWIASDELERREPDWRNRWWIGYRRMGPGERSFVPAILPSPAAGDSVFVIEVASSVAHVAALSAWLGSVLTDYCLRQKASQMNFFVVQQAPVPEAQFIEERILYGTTSVADFLTPRAIELSFTSFDMEPFGIAAGVDGPFRWDVERRSQIQAEIDAAVLAVSGLSREDCEWLLDSFRVLREVEVASLGEFRSKRMILEHFDRLTEAIASGSDYETPIDPPPGHGPRHDQSTRPDWIKE